MDHRTKGQSRIANEPSSSAAGCLAKIPMIVQAAWVCSPDVRTFHERRSARPPGAFVRAGAGCAGNDRRKRLPRSQTNPSAAASSGRTRAYRTTERTRAGSGKPNQLKRERPSAQEQTEDSSLLGSQRRPSSVLAMPGAPTGESSERICALADEPEIPVFQQVGVPMQAQLASLVAPDDRTGVQPVRPPSGDSCQRAARCARDPPAPAPPRPGLMR